MIPLALWILDADCIFTDDGIRLRIPKRLGLISDKHVGNACNTLFKCWNCTFVKGWNCMRQPSIIKVFCLLTGSSWVRAVTNLLYSASHLCWLSAGRVRSYMPGNFKTVKAVLKNWHPSIFVLINLSKIVLAGKWVVLWCGSCAVRAPLPRTARTVHSWQKGWALTGTWEPIRPSITLPPPPWGLHLLFLLELTYLYALWAQHSLLA